MSSVMYVVIVMLVHGICSCRLPILLYSCCIRQNWIVSHVHMGLSAGTHFEYHGVPWCLCNVGSLNFKIGQHATRPDTSVKRPKAGHTSWCSLFVVSQSVWYKAGRNYCPSLLSCGGGFDVSSRGRMSDD
ncbi:unnamed protein product [Sphacelaria rigidula]